MDELLTAADLADLQELDQSAQPASAQIQKLTLTSDGMGGQRATASIEATTTCRIRPIGESPEERVIADQLTGVVLQVLVFPAGTTIPADRRILVGARTFEVVAPLERSHETGRKIVCKELV